MAASPGRPGDHRIAEEQAALRRVAVLVARAAAPDEVFAAITAEAGRLLAADVTGITRYDPDGTAVAVGGWNRTGDALTFPIGTSVRLGGRNVVTLVSETDRPTRIDDVADASGEPAAFARERGFGSVVGAPPRAGCAPRCGRWPADPSSRSASTSSCRGGWPSRWRSPPTTRSPKR